MADWFETLRAASFRGVPFEVETTGLSGGRRVAVYEMPGRDQAVTEDTGRRPRLAPFAAYVIGEDAQAQAYRLLSALEAPGPGLLVHPLFGDLMVNATSYSMTASWAEGAACSFDLEFIEAGDLEFLDVDTSTAIDSTADALDAVAAGSLASALSTDGFADFVLTDAIAAAGALFDEVEAIVRTPFALIEDAGDLVADVAALKARATELVAAPGDFADAVAALLARIGDLFGLRSLASHAGEELGTANPATDDATQALANSYAIRRLLTQSALAAASRVLRDADLDVYDDSIAERDALAELLDAEALSADDDGAGACGDLRAAVVSDVTARAAKLARLTTHTQAAAVPTLTIAARLYDDAERADEIATRNRVVHPLFARGDLRVLSS